jgi:hypothetical protein
MQLKKILLRIIFILLLIAASFFVIINAPIKEINTGDTLWINWNRP